MADPILTAAEMIAFLERECKQSDSEREDWKLISQRFLRIISLHENVGAELRARIAQLEGELHRLGVISDDRRQEILRLTAENASLREALKATECKCVSTKDPRSYEPLIKCERCKSLGYPNMESASIAQSIFPAQGAK